ncbi:hypothetical protein ABBQ32_006662 [Trebouxia sp. C0010 RCD-2024]
MITSKFVGRNQAAVANSYRLPASNRSKDTNHPDRATQPPLAAAHPTPHKPSLITWVATDFLLKVSQKQAARSAQQAKDNISRHADQSQPAAASLQQQQQHQLRSQASTRQPRVQRATADEAYWRPQQAQHVQQHQPQEASSNSLQEDKAGEDVGVGRGFGPIGGAGVAAAMASGTAGASSSPQGRRGFMAGVAQLKAGPTQEQQNHARVLRERLLADLQQQVPPSDLRIQQSKRSATPALLHAGQTEERQQAEAKRKAAEAAAEAKQEADIAAYHARLRDKEALKHHQPSLGREDQPAATGAVRASPPESLSNSWNGPSFASQQAPSVVPRDPAHSPTSPDQGGPGHARQGRRQSRPGLASQDPQERPEHRVVEANRDISRPDSAAYKAKVGGVLAELQAEQARLRQLCSQQAAAMEDLQRQAQQAATQHGMPVEHFQQGGSHKGRSEGDRGRKQHQGMPARRWNLPLEEEGEGDSLDAFVVETRLVPVSLSQIPDCLPDHDLQLDHMDDALTHHQKHHFSPQSCHSQKDEGQQHQRPGGRQAKQLVDMSEGLQKRTKKDGKGRAFPKQPVPTKPKIWMR